MSPVTPIAIPIPKINICGIANPWLFIFFFWNINHYKIYFDLNLHILSFIF